MKRKTWALGGAAVLAAAAATGGAVVASGPRPATAAALQTPANTVKVERGPLADMVSLDGTLTFRARSDGSPYSAINQARGIYTKLPEQGDEVDCGETLYRVNDQPVLLLCGTIPAYRDLHIGDEGKDVRQLNRNLHVLGGDAFTWQTEKALKQVQHDKGVHVTGALDLDAAVFLPEPVRIAKVTAELGGPARPGAPVVQATSDTLEIQAGLESSQRGEVKAGDSAHIILPGNMTVKGKVERIGKVAARDATIPAYISLDAPKQAHGFDRAPVQVEIATKGVESALSVPVTALLGKSGGGFAVEVVRDGAQRELVAVELGLLDTASGRVEVEGDLEAGDPVVVPSL